MVHIQQGAQTTQHFCQRFKTMVILGTTRNIFDLSQISANIENEDVACSKKVVKRINISANMMLGEILDEMLHRLTGAYIAAKTNDCSYYRFRLLRFQMILSVATGYIPIR